MIVRVEKHKMLSGEAVEWERQRRFEMRKVFSCCKHHHAVGVEAGETDYCSMKKKSNHLEAFIRSWVQGIFMLRCRVNWDCSETKEELYICCSSQTSIISSMKQQWLYTLFSYSKCISRTLLNYLWSFNVCNHGAFVLMRKWLPLATLQNRMYDKMYLTMWSFCLPHSYFCNQRRLSNIIVQILQEKALAFKRRASE